jgi:hypothetical protein
LVATNLVEMEEAEEGVVKLWTLAVVKSQLW